MSSRRAQGARQIANRRMSELGYDSAQFYPQLWLLLVSLMIFASYVAWDLRLFSLILISDKSYMATLIMALVLLMSVHCGWHILHTSRYSLHALRFLDDTGTFLSISLSDWAFWAPSSGSYSYLRLWTTSISKVEMI